MKSTLTGILGTVLSCALLLFSLRAQTAIAVTSDGDAQLLNLSAVNTPYSEYTPFITADEHFLFFQSNRPDGVDQAGDFDLWYSENEVTEGTPKFKAPANVGLPVNSAYFDGHPTLRKLPTGEYEMYFCSFAEEGRQGPQLTNLYYTILKNDKWSVPTPVVEINSDFHDRMPSISQDGRYLYFSSDRPGGFGRDDIWISEYDYAAKRWGKPYNAGRSINTPASEVTPAIHSDNITLYFSSDRAGGVGGYDIYVTQMLPSMPGASTSDAESIWKKPVNLGKPYNSEYDDEYPTVIRSGNFMYFASNRQNGQGSFDIYRGKVPNFAKPEVVVTLKGRVKEKFSEKGLEANIRITDVEGERNFSTHQPEGLYSADLINKKQYKMTVTAPGYQAIEYIADLRDVHSPVTIQKDFEMERALNLPKEVVINIEFVDEKGKTLKPNATYRLTPDMADDIILPFKKGKGRVGVAAMSKYKKPEDAMAALERQQLGVKATLKGYNDAAETKSLPELMRGNHGDLKGAIDWKIVMKSVGETEQSFELKDCNAIKGCVRVAYFSTNVSNRLNNEKALELKSVVDLWNKQPHKYVYVHGHADNRGAAAHNMKLSRARAAFVKRRLVQFGIPAEMIITKGYGATKPAVKDESTAEGRRKNRRAEIYFEATKKPGDADDFEEAAEKPVEKPAPKKKVKKIEKKKVEKKKPMPPEEVEPSVKPKPIAKPEADAKPMADEAKPAATKPAAKPVVEEKPFTEPKPGAPAVGPPNTEIKVQ